VNDPLMIAAIVGAVASIIAGAVPTVRNRRADTATYLVAAAAEVAALALAAAVIVGLVRGADVTSLATFLGDLAVLVLALPVGVVWAVGDDTRWGGLVVSIAGLTVAVVVLRMQSLWLGFDA
jgi:hypothetical protein